MGGKILPAAGANIGSRTLNIKNEKKLRIRPKKITLMSKLSWES